MTFSSIDGPTVTGHTADLHASFPRDAYVILVHAPSKSDGRFGRHDITLDTLFHPHDPAPSVLYVAAFDDAPLTFHEGRHHHQVDRAGTERLRKRFGDFVVLVLDSRGKILLSATEPPSRRELQKAVGHRDRKETHRPVPPHPPRRTQ